MTPMDPDALSLGAAFVAGIAGSGHCLGMCGGIAGALAMRLSRGTSPQRRPGWPAAREAEAA